MTSTSVQHVRVVSAASSIKGSKSSFIIQEQKTSFLFMKDGSDFSAVFLPSL